MNDPMDLPCTPYEDLPGRLRREMLLLQQYKDRVRIQALRVVDVAVTEWQEADAQAERTAAALQLARELTDDSEECTCAVCEKDADKVAYFEAFTFPQKPSRSKPPGYQAKARRTRSAITGYYSVRRETFRLLYLWRKNQSSPKTKNTMFRKQKTRNTSGQAGIIPVSNLS